ncbi:hypothetical protein ACI2KR_08760 [Pseudomonas luteola]
MKDLPRVFGYVVNLNERGDFNADVRDLNDKTIYEVKMDHEEGHIPQVEDGFMRHSTDISGLQSYLTDLGFLQKGDKLLNEKDFSRVQEKYFDNDRSLPQSGLEI